MKKYIIILLVELILGIGAFLMASHPALGDTIGTLDVFKIVGSLITPRDSTKGFQIPLLGSSGSPCVSVSSLGTFATTTCGSGGGSTLATNTVLSMLQGGVYNIWSSGFYNASSSQFSNATITQLSLNNIAYTWPVAQGASSTVLTNNGIGGLSWGTSSGGGLTASGTAGTLQFYGSSSALNGNQNLLWDNTNNRLGIGTITPASTFHVAYDASSTASTNFALQLGTTPLTSPSANGTGIGYNALSSFTGNLIDFQLGGASKFKVTSAGSTFIPSGSLLGAGATSADGGFAIASNNGVELGVAAGKAFIATTAGSKFGQICVIADAVWGLGQTASSPTTCTAAQAVLVWTGTGLVGIGTGTPASALQVDYDASSTTSTKLSIQMGDKPLSSPSASGTYLGANALSSFTGNLINLQTNNTNEMVLTSAGAVTFGGNGTFTGGQVTAATKVQTNLIGANTTNLTLSGNEGSTAAGDDVTVNNGTSRNTTGSGNATALNIQDTFAPTSGTATFHGLHVSSTINQTLTATGISRGIFINPTLTGVADFRALETAAKNVTYTASSVPVTAYQNLFNPYTYATASTAKITIATSSTLDIAGAPVASSTNLVILTKSIGLNIESNVLNASTTNGYGAYIAAPSGAGNNWGAWIVGNLTQTSVINCDDATHQLGADSNGTIVCDTALSDARLKKNIQTLNGSDSLSLFSKIRFVQFNWKDTGKGIKDQFGVVAQEVQNVFPNIVTIEPNGYYSMNYQGLFSQMGAALQELSGKVNAVLSRLDGQDKKIKAMQAQLDKQQQQINLLLQIEAKRK